MSYQIIKTEEITTGAPVDEKLLAKIKANTDDLNERITEYVPEVSQLIWSYNFLGQSTDGYNSANTNDSHYNTDFITANDVINNAAAYPHEAVRLIRDSFGGSYWILSNINQSISVGTYKVRLYVMSTTAVPDASLSITINNSANTVVTKERAQIENTEYVDFETDLTGISTINTLRISADPSGPSYGSWPVWKIELYKT